MQNKNKQVNRKEPVKPHNFTQFQLNLLKAFNKVLKGDEAEFEVNVIKTYYEFLPELNSIKHMITSKDVYDCVKNMFDLTDEQLQHGRAKQEARLAKMIYHKLCNMYTKETQEQIARTLGNKNHSSHIVGLNTANDTYEIDRGFRNLFQICEDRLLGKIEKEDLPMPSIPLAVEQDS